MKFPGHVLILILLALGCVGSSDKAKSQSEMQEEIVANRPFQPEYQHLIDMYNDGERDGFYTALDAIRIRKQSSVIKRMGDFKSGKLYPNPFSTNTPEPWGIPCGVRKDSSLVSILILDEEKKLLWIEYNDILQSGDYIYYNELPNLKSGIYYYLLKVESEESLESFGILR
jgi:hypothetical protein